MRAVFYRFVRFIKELWSPRYDDPVDVFLSRCIASVLVGGCLAFPAVCIAIAVVVISLLGFAMFAAVLIAPLACAALAFLIAHMPMPHDEHDLLQNDNNMNNKVQQ